MSNIVDENNQESSKSVKEMTQDEFDKEWERLFPLSGELPESLKYQAS